VRFTAANIANKPSRKRRIDGKLGLMVMAEALQNKGKKQSRLWLGSSMGSGHV